jgi:hypothetical protein
VKREFGPNLPHVFAHGSELNQVWTNLIDNAIDAMGGKGELIIRTSRKLDFVLVEIIDNGPGIADDVKTHIFEPPPRASAKVPGWASIPFIVRAHRGENSEPGEPAFRCDCRRSRSGEMSVTCVLARLSLVKCLDALKGERSVTDVPDRSSESRPGTLGGTPSPEP